MKKMSLQMLKACSLSVALLGSVAVVAAVSMPDVAYAKSGNDNGGGNGNAGGNGNGNGNGGGNSDKSGGGNGKADKADKKSGGDSAKSKAKEKAKAKVKAKAKPKKKDLAEELGVHPSELGALNAAHANENALKNASPNSRVGKIAAYRDAVVAGELLVEELATKKAALDLLDPPERSSDLVKIDLDIAAEETATAAGIVGGLEANLAAADPTDTALVTQLQADLDAALGTLDAAEQAEAALQAEYDGAVAYETLEDEVADLTQKVEDQPELETSLLDAAANKEVTPEVEAAVKKLLGL